jgi:two-component system, NtrC family, sensor histidine kinase HydH
MADERSTAPWLDLLWLLFLAGLAILPPINEPHKQVILLLLGVFQLLERAFIQHSLKRWGPALAVIAKLVLATELINHTRDVAPIISSYWPVFFVPVTTAAIYFGPVGTLLWTTLTSAAYCSYLIPALKEFKLEWSGASELMMRVLFLYLVAMTVNRFVMDARFQVRRYQSLSETLAEANRNLQQAQAEARRAERLAALGQLSAGLAHEIRNPLGVIKGSAEILKQKLGAADEMARELSDYIYTEVNRVSALVSRFLDFARPTTLDLSTVDLSEVVEKSLKAVADQGADGNVRIVRDYAPGTPRVELDEDLSEQVFTNLILNACEAMGDQGGELKIRTFRESNEEHELAVAEIEDTGPGVAAGMREQIFNPFVSTKKTGVGLGLAIVSKIVDAHGGRVTLGESSTSGKGACFRVTFPGAKTESHAGTQGSRIGTIKRQ